MSKTSLKNFDIASFDLEIEFNKKIAPITKKIDTLMRNHEKKSLANHKDFLSKEKKSKKKLEELDEIAILRDQRITKATENKLKKHHTVDAKLKKDLEDFSQSQFEANKILLDEIEEIVEELKKSEAADLEVVEKKYTESVQAYNEKLTTYNVNFEENVIKHQEQLANYQRLVDSILAEITDIKENGLAKFNSQYDLIIAQKEEKKSSINSKQDELEKELNKFTTDIRKESNLKVKNIKDTIEQMQHQVNEKYENYIKELKEHIGILHTDFSERKALIEADLMLNTEKLQQELASIEDPNKKFVKTIELKKSLFKTRATTTISYEERIYLEQVKLLQAEIDEYKLLIKFEAANIDKLEVFSLSDQTELKETGDYFKKINLDLKKQLDFIEVSYDEYLVKHEKIKADYLNNFVIIFDDFKRTLLESNQTTIERLGQINREIDDINKYLDTAEPLREIEVNKIRVNIEKSEITERYNIKYAKQEHEKKVIDSTLQKDITIREFDNRREAIQNNKDITEIKSKEMYDKEIEKAKLKFNKAEEIHRLRMNSTRLERSLLKSNYESETAILEHKKELSVIEVERENAMITNELRSEENNINTETMYKVEVINHSLIEDTMKLEDEISSLILDKKNYISKMDLEITKEKNIYEKSKREIENNYIQKSTMIDKALIRELKEPEKSLRRAKSIIDDRMNNFELNNIIFEDFIQDMKQNIDDDSVSDDQKKIIVEHDVLYIDKSKNYVKRMYASLTEANIFIHDLKVRTIQSKLSSTTDESKAKKLDKQLQKMELEFTKHIENLELAEKEHTNSISNSIYENIEKIKHFAPTEQQSLLSFISQQLDKTYKNLKSLQDNVIKEVQNLYSVLTKADLEIIDHAKSNAIKAKKLLEDEKDKKLKPFVTELEKIISSKNETKTKNVAEMDIKINEVKAEKERVKNNALEAVQLIENERDALLAPIKEHLDAIIANEKQKMEQMLSEIDTKILELDELNTITLKKLQAKDDEADKILDYEQKIYNIAIETAETRLNERNLKAETVFLDQLKLIEKKKTEVYENHDKMIFAINEELVNLTKEFEKNIFTVRPRLEESIGDAQKIIENEMKTKKERLEQLNNQSDEIAASLENNLNLRYQESYNKMHTGLQFYFDKLRVVKEDFVKNNNEFDEAIDANSTVFTNALFELGKNKHHATITKLLEINKTMTGEEV